MNIQEHYVIIRYSEPVKAELK